MINRKTAIYDERVLAKDYEGYIATNPKVTTYIGNYYEVQVEGYVQPTSGGSGQPCSAPSFCSYMPIVANTIVNNVSYYYADGQRIAMKTNGAVSYLYGDQLGSVSAVADVNGSLVSKTLYHPWGSSRYSQGTTPTDYAYTGQMQKEDIYFYNARWYDPTIGRFMQADTIVPTTQGIQGFDRYAYVINNPLKYADPSGHCIDGVSTAFCVVAGAMVIGAIGGYVAQVAQNMSAGLSFGDALVTDISATPILQGAAIAGLGVTAAITGGAALGVGASTIVTVGQGACADGDCTNEGALALEGLKKTGEFFSDKIGSTGSIGQKTLELISGTSQKFFPTPYGGRFIDRLSDLGTAMEAKVGYQALTYTIKTQIMKDAFLVQNHPAIQVVEWHFFRSPVTGKIGPSGPLRDFLIENGFKAIIH